MHTRDGTHLQEFWLFRLDSFRLPVGNPNKNSNIFYSNRLHGRKPRSINANLYSSSIHLRLIYLFRVGACHLSCIRNPIKENPIIFPNGLHRRKSCPFADLHTLNERDLRLWSTECRVAFDCRRLERRRKSWRRSLRPRNLHFLPKKFRHIWCSRCHFAIWLAQCGMETYCGGLGRKWDDNDRSLRSIDIRLLPPEHEQRGSGRSHDWLRSTECRVGADCG